MRSVRDAMRVAAVLLFSLGLFATAAVASPADGQTAGDRQGAERAAVDQPPSEPRATDPWEPDIAAFEAQDKANPPPRGGVVFVGSSSIRMWTTLAQDFPGIDVINRGFGGSDIRDSTRYASRLVAPHKPRLVVLYAGDNDLMAGRSPRQVEQDFIAFVDRLRRQAPRAKIAFIAIKPSPSRAHLLDQVQDANRRIARAAATRKGVDFIDIATPMLDANGQPRPELFIEDMLHLNAEGYRLWTTIVAPYLK